MAAPRVAATVVRLLDRDLSMTVDEVRERLNATARDLGEEGYDEADGRGRVAPVAAWTGAPVWRGGGSSSMEG